MIPVFADELLYNEDVEEEAEPGLTWKLNEDSKTVQGLIDERDAVQQAIYCMLRTERFYYEIYSEDYGVELSDRFGQPLAFVKLEIEDTITETLLQDDRIEEVTDFIFTEIPNGLHVEFTVTTNTGESIEAEWEVTQDGGLGN